MANGQQARATDSQYELHNYKSLYYHRRLRQENLDRARDDVRVALGDLCRTSAETHPLLANYGRELDNYFDAVDFAIQGRSNIHVLESLLSREFCLLDLNVSQEATSRFLVDFAPHEDRIPILTDYFVKVSKDVLSVGSMAEGLSELQMRAIICQRLFNLLVLIGEGLHRAACDKNMMLSKVERNPLFKECVEYIVEDLGWAYYRVAGLLTLEKARKALEDREAKKQYNVKKVREKAQKKFRMRTHRLLVALVQDWQDKETFDAEFCEHLRIVFCRMQYRLSSKFGRSGDAMNTFPNAYFAEYWKEGAKGGATSSRPIKAGELQVMRMAPKYPSNDVSAAVTQYLELLTPKHRKQEVNGRSLVTLSKFKVDPAKPGLSGFTNALLAKPLESILQWNENNDIQAMTATLPPHTRSLTSYDHSARAWLAVRRRQKEEEERQRFGIVFGPPYRRPRDRDRGQFNNDEHDGNRDRFGYGLSGRNGRRDHSPDRSPSPPRNDRSLERMHSQDQNYGRAPSAFGPPGSSAGPSTSRQDRRRSYTPDEDPSPQDQYLDSQRRFRGQQQDHSRPTGAHGLPGPPAGPSSSYDKIQQAHSTGLHGGHGSGDGSGNGYGYGYGYGHNNSGNRHSYGDNSSNRAGYGLNSGNRAGYGNNAGGSRNHGGNIQGNHHQGGYHSGGRGSGGRGGYNGPSGGHRGNYHGNSY